MRPRRKHEAWLRAADFDSRIRTVMNRLFEEDTGLRASFDAEAIENPRWEAVIAAKGAGCGFSSCSFDVIFDALTDDEKTPGGYATGTAGAQYQIKCNGNIPLPARVLMEHVVLYALEDLTLADLMERLADNPALALLGREGVEQLARPTEAAAV